MSEDLARALNLGGNDWGFTEELAHQLGLRGVSDAADELLTAMLETLEDVIQEGPPPEIIENRGRRVVDAALEELDATDELLDLIVDLGHGDHTTPKCELRRLRCELKGFVASRLASRVNRMLARWEKEGHLDLAARQRRIRARIDLENADRRRERRARPKLSWDTGQP